MAKIEIKCKPIKILDIFVTQNGQIRQSKYELKLSALKKLLEPVKNIEVFVLGIIGVSRRGKSFILNYMHRYLIDPNDSQWIGKINEPLEGFEWHSSDKAQTFGIWFSKPKVLKQSNGKDIAVILMDTQGLFDDIYQERDWSTIAGISLLTSSCLIFNLFTNISEDMLKFFDTYINYGLKAAEENTDSSGETPPYQSLLFLVRDWNFVNQHRYGLDGGKQYLETKLIVKENQSLQAQNVRKNIKKCFNNVSCFLMPPFGDVMENDNFNGSINQLNNRFKELLNEFVTKILNPEDLIPNTIDRTAITGEELLQQLQSVVEVFNREELPDSQQILEANAKLSGNIFIRKLKDQHLNHMRGFIQTKAFMTREELSKQNEIYRKELIEEFESSKKSSDIKLSDRLLESIKNNFDEIFNENENRRKAFIEKSIEKCGLMFTNLVNEDLKDNRFVESDVFESKFKTYEREVFNEFEMSFSGEEKSLFENDYFKTGARTTNHERIKEFEKTKDIYVKNVTDYYEQKMDELLKNSVYLSKEKFKNLEKNIRNETENKFKVKYEFKNQNENEFFYLKVNQKLKESKNEFKKQNIKKCKDVSELSKNIVHKSVLLYKHELDENIRLIRTIDDFEYSHQIALKKAIEVLLTCPFQEPDFFDDYYNLFNEEIIKLYNEIKTNLIEKIDTQNTIYEMKLSESLLIYQNGMKESLQDQKFSTTEMLGILCRKQQREAIKHFEKNSTETTKQDQLYLKYQFQLNQKIIEESDKLIETFEENKRSEENKIELLFNQFKQKFESDINSLMESAINFDELSNLFIKFKNSSKAEIFEDNGISNRIIIKNKLLELDNFLDRRLQEIKAQFEMKKEKTFKEYQNKVIQSKFFYKNKMDQFLDNNEYTSDDQLRQFHDDLTNDIKCDLNSNLKPAFDFDIKLLIDKCFQSISVEYQNYLKKIEDNRDMKFNSIKENCRKFIDEYETKIQSNLKCIKSVEELQDKHKSILELILENSIKTIQKSDNNLIILQTSYIKDELSKKFSMVLKQFDEGIVQIEEKYQHFQKQTESFYLKEIDSLFNNKQTYEEAVLDGLLSKYRITAINKFNVDLKQNSLCFDQFKLIYSNKLNDSIEAINLKYKKMNIEQWEKSLDDHIIKAKGQYITTMESHLCTAESEKDLRSKHKETIENLFKDFEDEFSSFQSSFAWTKRIELRKFFDNEISSMADKFSDNMNTIRKICHDTSEKLLNEFIQKMNELTDKDNNRTSDQEFSKMQEKHRKNALESFETHLKESKCQKCDAEMFLENFKQSVEDKSKYFIVCFKTKIQDQLKNLVKKYDKEMKEKFPKFKSFKDLNELHNEIKHKLIEEFRKLNDFGDKTIFNTYLKELEENFDKSYEENKYVLEMELSSKATLDELLRNSVRRHYLEKMDTFLKNNLFIPENQLKTNHETVLKNTIDKFKSEREEMTEIELSDFVKKTVSDLYTKIDLENEMRRPTDSIAVGIDLGTTNSCVAVFDAKSRAENNIVVIPNELGHKTTPSVVSFRDNKVLIVGDVAKDDIHAYPKNTISSVKRLIGQSFSSISAVNDFCSYNIVKGKDDLPMISVKRDGKEETYFAEQISAEILKKLKKNAEKHLNCKISKAVITIPAYFTDAQREATKQAGQLAKLEVLRIINEPTAAAIAFRVDRNDEKEERKVLIYDFGGGTFDVSLLEINKGVINVLGVDGNNHLGGDDFDQALIEHCLKRFTNQYQISLTGTDKEVALCRLRSECEKHKKRLSAVELTVINIDNFHENKDLSIEVTRSEFEELIDHLIVDSIKLVENVLNTAKIKQDDIEDIVLVGGSTRIPRVQQSLSELFNGRPLNYSVNPDEAVAKGAAMQAAILNGQLASGYSIKLNDVTPLSLGVEVNTKELSVIIPRNTKIPTKFNRFYRTTKDNQTFIEISIYEGENIKIAQANHLLGQFIVNGIPAAPARKEQLDVTFTINEEGMLSVKARVVSTGSEEGIQITEHKGRLTTEIIEKLLKESSEK